MAPELEDRNDQPARKTLEPLRSDRPLLHAPERPGAIWGPLLAVCALALLLILGAWHHVQQKREQEAFAENTSVITVSSTTVRRDSRPHELVLPGAVNAFIQTTLYARANGYLARRYVDIGDKVREGQLLAEIEAPDVDAQMRQALATVAQSRANLDNARLNFERAQNLIAKKVVSQQEFDQNRTAFDAARASVQASDANLQNLRVQQGFQKIVAPFSGEITSRMVDVGALVAAGSGSAGTALFGMAQTDPLRVYVSVPQTNVPSIRADLPANLLVPEYPGRNFAGVVARFSGAIDPTTRTLLTEVDIPNPEGMLFAGMYGSVKFVLKDDSSPIIIPSDALLFQAVGPRVAIIDRDNKVHWKNVRVGRDFGTQMEILEGLEENAQVVVNPTDDLVDGLSVKIKPYEKPAAPGQSSGVPGKAAR